MSATTKSNVIIPELLTEAVQGALAKENAFMGSVAARLGIVEINDTFPGGNIGDVVSVPYFSSIGRFTSRADGTPATTNSISQSKEQNTVDLASLSFEVTRWARSGIAAAGGKDPYEEIARQVVNAATEYLDTKMMTAAVAGSGQLVVDKFDATTPRKLDWDLLCDGKEKFQDFQSDIVAIAVHSRTQGDLARAKDSVGRPLLLDPVAEGGVQRVMGLPLIVSDRLPVDGTSMTAVTSAGTTPPVITLTATSGFTGPTRPVDVKIACTTLGARGTWKFKLSIDGGATYGADDQYTSAATVDLIDPLDPVTGTKLGVTLNIATGTAAVDNTWVFKSILKHTSLILKKSSMVFWYARQAMDLQTVAVPQNDSVIGAMHCYAVGHRYLRHNQSPLPGIVKLRHNAGGL